MELRGWFILAGVACALSVLLMVAAPYMAPYGTFTGLDGLPAHIDHGWQGHGPAGAAYLLGDIFCHQEHARCLVLNGSQMPICIRDLGILTGASTGFLLSSVLGRRLEDVRWGIAGFALILVTGAEWALEGIVGDMPTARLASGMVTGIGAGIFLGWFASRGTSGGNQEIRSDDDGP